MNFGIITGIATSKIWAKKIDNIIAFKDMLYFYGIKIKHPVKQKTTN